MATPLDAETIEKLRIRHPTLRNDYFDYISRIGWGETQTGRMIYEGPIEFDEIYNCGAHAAQVLLLGDDLQGYCFGYNLDTGCYGEVSDDGTWEPWTNSRGITHYTTESQGPAT